MGIDFFSSHHIEFIFFSISVSSCLPVEFTLKEIPTQSSPLVSSLDRDLGDKQLPQISQEIVCSVSEIWCIWYIMGLPFCQICVNVIGPLGVESLYLLLFFFIFHIFIFFQGDCKEKQVDTDTIANITPYYELLIPKFSAFVKKKAYLFQKKSTKLEKEP